MEYTTLSTPGNTGKIRCSVQVVWGALIDVIIQPVCIQIVGMGSPHQKRTVFRVVVAVVVFRHFNREIFAKIAFVLAVQGDTVVFRVTHYKNLAAVFCHGKKDLLRRILQGQ